jgi:hypothetical protein
LKRGLVDMGFVESLKRGLSLSTDTAKEGVGFGKARFIECVKYLAYGALAALGVLVAYAVLVALVYLLAPAIGNLATLVSLGASGVAALIAMFLLYTSAEFGLIEYVYSGKRVGCFERRNVVSAAKWGVFLLLVVLVVGIPLALFTIALFHTELPVDMVVGIVRPILLIAIYGFGLAAYFAKPEIAVKGKGPLSAFSGSWNIVKANFWEVVLFAVLLYAVSEAATIIPITILVIGMVIGVLPLFISPGLIVVAIAIIALMVLGIFAVSLAVEAASTLLVVRFYRRIAGKGEGMGKMAAG